MCQGPKYIMSQSGNTPLIAAANNGDTAIVQHLIDHKARLDIANRNGDTALHRAAYQCHTYVVELLVTAGAPLDVLNNVCLYFGYLFVCINHAMIIVS